MMQESIRTVRNMPFYTREPDGTIQKWYLVARHGDLFAVAAVKNAKLKDYNKYFRIEDVGKRIFTSRKEAEKGVKG